MDAVPPDAVLFDLDGVLVDSRRAFATSVNAALTAHGLPPRKPEDLHGFLGPPLHATFAELTGGDDALVQSCVDAYRTRYRRMAATETEVFAGIPALLESLLGAGVALVVATSKPQALAEPLLATLGLLDRFRAVVGPDLEERHEPKATTVRRALGQVPGARGAAMVGDRRFDMLAAREHDLHAIGVSWGIGTPEELLVAGADDLVQTPEALRALLLDR